MTSRGFGTEAAKKIAFAKVLRVAPREVGIASLERGIARRSKRIVAPWWVAGVLPIRMVAQPLMDRVAQRGLDDALRVAREEAAPLTTRSEERRVGKECVGTCRSRWSPLH